MVATSSRYALPASLGATIRAKIRPRVSSPSVGTRRGFSVTPSTVIGRSTASERRWGRNAPPPRARVSSPPRPEISLSSRSRSTTAG